MELLTPLNLRGVTAANRVMFGPHVTNLGDDERRFTTRHTAYYERRARGGCGIVVTEGASVHDSDWPYERAPLASRGAQGWAAIAEACHRHGSLLFAALDHAGGQGSSAYHQRELWAPSRVPEVNSREVPKWMETGDIAAVVDGFAAAAATAIAAGCDGVEINAGQHSLVRQFLSGLTNHRDDLWGTDRWLFAAEIVEAVRAAAGDAPVGLRLCCDELAPWAGITPEQAPDLASRLVAQGVDYLVVTRGSIFSVDKTRADFHEPEGFNADVCRAVRQAVPGTPVFLQGSVVRWEQAQWAVADGVCDGVEMTRAQLADPDLVVKLGGTTDERGRIRTCLRCNQTCQVRDARNPLVTCVVEPSTGHETTDPDWWAPARTRRDVLVVGGGVAGLETARVAAARGHRVRLVERDGHLGGLVAVAGPGAAFAQWLVDECRLAGVEVVTGADMAEPRAGEVVVQCTGSVAGDPTYGIVHGAVVIDVADIRRGAELPAGTIVLHDPIGGPIAVALAEELGPRAVLVTPDQIAGNELSRSGDLAPANVRLQQRGVRIERRSILRLADRGAVEVEDRFSGEVRRIECAALVDCGFRLPSAPLTWADRRAGDCVAPRTILEAVLEARRVALSL